MLTRVVLLATLLRISIAGPGALDLSFQPVSLQADLYAGFLSMALQADGKILVGGHFDGLNGQDRPGIARLNSDGSLDATFNPPTTTNSFVSCIVVQGDGKILVNTGMPREGVIDSFITRLNYDGTVDTDFDPPTISCKQFALAPDGKIYLAGWFTLTLTEPPSKRLNFLARLNSNGELDATFAPSIGGFGTSEDGEVRVALQPDGQVVLAGIFSAEGRTALARFHDSGALDLTFHRGDTTAYFCNVLALQPDGKILHGHTKSLAGSMGFDTYAAVRRFNSDGSLDTTFAVNRDAPGYVNAIALQPDGKILAVGGFYTPGRYWRQNLIRFNPDGTRDDSLVFGEGYFSDTTSGNFQSVIVQPNGRILVAGTFDYPAVNGVARPNIVRLQGDAAYLTKLSQTGGELEVNWAIADREKIYRVESSTNLVSWTHELESLPGESLLRYRAALDQRPAKFFRLNAVTPSAEKPAAPQKLRTGYF